MSTFARISVTMRTPSPMLAFPLPNEKRPSMRTVYQSAMHMQIRYQLQIMREILQAHDHRNVRSSTWTSHFGLIGSLPVTMPISRLGSAVCRLGFLFVGNLLLVGYRQAVDAKVRADAVNDQVRPSEIHN